MAIDQQINTTRHREMRVRGISAKSQREIKNIARYHGMSVSDFFKPILLKIIQEYPDYMKVERNTTD